MFEIIILINLCIFLYAFSDDITYRIAQKRIKRKARKLMKEAAEKGSDQK